MCVVYGFFIYINGVFGKPRLSKLKSAQSYKHKTKCAILKNEVVTNVA